MKNLDNLKITKYETSIAALPDRIENRADWLKRQFDGRTDNEVKKQHNALVDEVARFEDDTHPKGDVYTKEEIDVQEAALSARIITADSKAQAAQDNLDDFKGRRDNPHMVTADQTGAYPKEEVYTKVETDSAIDEKIVQIGAGDMAKEVYDENDNGIVDNSERLGGELPAAFMKVANYGGSDENTVQNSDKVNGYSTFFAGTGNGLPSAAYVVAFSNNSGHIGEDIGSHPIKSDEMLPISIENLAKIVSRKKNLLDNWYFINPVNQREISGTFSSAGQYFIDRWILESGTVEITPNGLNLNGVIKQKLEFQVRATATASVKGAGTASYSDATKEFKITGNGLITAAKLEIGKYSSLDNDARSNFAEELSKCQRYYWAVDKGAGASAVLMRAAAVNILTGNVPFPVTLRKIGGSPKIILSQVRNALTGAIHTLSAENVLTTSDGIVYIGANFSPILDIGGFYELQDLTVDANL